MKKWTWMLIAVVMVGLIGGASVLYDQLSADFAPAQSVTEAAVELAPDFTVTDGEGNEVKLSDFFGKPIVLNFWASWCGPCQYEMPDFEKAYQQYGEEVQFLMVNLTDGYSETVNSAKTFLSGTGYTFPAYFDTLSDASKTYQVYSIPCTYFLDTNGSVVSRTVGMISADALQQGIDLIFSE